MKQLHLIAGKDPINPQFQTIVVQNGFVYVTNKVALIKMPTEMVFGKDLIAEDETLIFDANLWSVLKFSSAKIISRTGLNFFNATAGTTIIAKSESEIDFKIPPYESIIPKADTKPIEISYIGLNPMLLADLAKVFGTKANAFTLQFYGVDKTFEVLHVDFPEVKAYLFPCFNADKVEGYKEPYRHTPIAPTATAEQAKGTPSTKVKKQKTSSDSVIDQILELLDKHKGTTKAILDDYCLGDEDCRMELGCADDNLREAIAEIDVEDDFGKLLNKVKDHDDYSSDELLKLITDLEGEDVLHEYLQTKGYAIIKIDNIQDQSKLQTFVETELYPFYSDRNKYSI